MFKSMLKRNRVTPEDLKKAIAKLRKSGCTSQELEHWMSQLQQESALSSLVFCTDEEGACMDRVISATLHNYPGLMTIIKLRYQGRGKSKSYIARELNDVRPEWSFKTCQRRVDSWLSAAEYSLYLPMNDAFNLNSERFVLKTVQRYG
ncbi:hypothetical protein ABMA09_14090 [Erwinia rhapontici]